MAEPFLSEIRIMSFNFAPKGWALCNGQLLPINQNQALFSLLGTTFGGNGHTTFALPNLQGRAPIHVRANKETEDENVYILGQTGGEETHTLTTGELPTHLHMPNATNNNGDTPNPNGAFLGAASNVYHAATNLTSLNPASVGNAGGSHPHENRMPYLVLSFCIALQGIVPSPN